MNRKRDVQVIDNAVVVIRPDKYGAGPLLNDCFCVECRYGAIGFDRNDNGVHIDLGCLACGVQWTAHPARPMDPVGKPWRPDFAWLQALKDWAGDD